MSDSNEITTGTTLFENAGSRKLIDPENYPMLLVEDNPDDIWITPRDWEKGLIKNKLYVVNDGEQALEFLYKK